MKFSNLVRTGTIPSPVWASSSCHSYFLMFLSLTSSSLANICSAQISTEADPLSITRVFAPCSSYLSDTQSYDHQLSWCLWIPSSISSTSRSHRDLTGFPFPAQQPENTLTALNGGNSSTYVFDSHLSSITTLCCLMSSVLQTIISFILFFFVCLFHVGE